MSNPCINRWGINSIWNHYWYSDNRYALNLKFDKILIDLVTTYLTFGMNVKSSLFYNPYWFKTSLHPAKSNTTLFYRWVSMYSDALRATSTYRLRIESEEIFTTQFNILKFDSWLVLNFYWFQPDKNRKRRILSARTRLSSKAHSTSTSTYSSLSKFTALMKHSHQTQYFFE